MNETSHYQISCIRALEITTKSIIKHASIQELQLFFKICFLQRLAYEPFRKLVLLRVKKHREGMLAELSIQLLFSI